MAQTSNRTTSVEPLIESLEEDFRDSGIPSTVAVAGHPLHPLIVTFPITFLVTALATDVAFWWTDNPFWAQASFWLIGAGLAFGVLAALTGMLDFFGIKRVRERKAGWFHMIGNVAALSLTLVNFVLRWGKTAGAIMPTGLALSILVAALLGITGWYGGELVYRHKISVVGSSDRTQA
jgi:uncharacterized membrane protein